MRSIGFGAFAIFVLFVRVADSKFLDVDVDVQDECIIQCHIQNHSEVEHYGDEFGRREQQCEEGCRLWRSALNSSCQAVCDGSIQVRLTRLSAKELYCIIGCKDAVNRYYTELRKKIGIPPAPALVADSLTATSLRLEWKFPEAREAGLRYFLQWKYQEQDGAWQYCRNQSWGPEDTVCVDNLQPYTKYRFRVTLVLSNLTEPIVSPPSVVISTRPEGVPASPPNIVRAVAIDSTRISVSWEPGPFPHGPLLSYVLRITDNQPQGYSALKDLPADHTFYICKALLPNHNYTIHINMLNGAGEGPSANVTVRTPEQPKAKDSEKPVLILGGHHIVFEQGTAMLDEPVILYNSNEFINGLAIHVSKQLLFVSDSARYVHRMPLHKYTNSSGKVSILSPSQINFTPQDLSMDWLNEHLYILGEVERQSKAWQIARCNLDGRGLTIAIAGLMSKPHHIEVDPYNGYLFWVNAHGLYRLDLADISNGIKHEVQPELILADVNLGAFTVDHTNFRVLVANQNNNTINSVSLDGKEVNNMREKIITPRLEKVVSLARANDRFYWTNGNEILYEEYHPDSDSSFFHNSYPLEFSRTYIKVLVNLTSSQPTPIPVNPPTSVQAIFGTDIAKTTWQIPHLLGGQGKGAWQNWSYQIMIKDLEENTTQLCDINSTSYTITNLKPNTKYGIIAAAYTNFGNGPWSTEFIGRTLQINKDGNQPTILWSSMDGLLKSDATGENVEIAIHKSHMSGYYFKKVAWYKDDLYLVTDKFKVLWYNMKTHQHSILNEIDAAGSIAIDWLGKRLYWMNPKLQIITRGYLNGTHQEPLLHVMAEELEIDSIRGYLYWSTGHAVECARLNGDDKFVYHPAAYFSGSKVVGLTLDKDHQYVYWILQGLNSSSLYRSRMIGTRYFHSGKPKIEEVAILQPNVKGSLCYFNNRLIWLKNNETAIISDLEGKYTASIRGNSLLGLNMMYVMDSSHYIKPNATKYSSIKGISVIPEAINKYSVKVVGVWDNFNITWLPIQNVNYGTVFYEIIIANTSRNNSNSTDVTTFPTIKYNKEVDPYMYLHITLRAYTYWGSSPPIKVKIHSPPSTPSAPRNLRSFVLHQHSGLNTNQANITFRWDSPANSNGILEGYKVTWWYMEENTCYNDSIVMEASEKEYVVIGALENTTYYIQVQAFTEIGDGDLSNIYEVNTRTESPVPTLLIASPDSIYIQDIDTNQNYSLMSGISTPIEMGYLIRERKVFWINDMQELYVYNLANNERGKVFTVDGNVISMTIDWLERSVYYLQIDDMQGSFLYKVDLNYYEKLGRIRHEQVFRTPATISKIEVSPFTKEIYWIESDFDKTKHRLMKANIDGTNITPFFSQRSRSKRDSDLQDCSCPIHPSVGKAFTLDHSTSNNLPQIIYVDSTSRSIISSDKHGCNCTVLVNNTLIGNSYPIALLKADLDKIYWLDKTKTLLYSIKKHVQNSLVQDQISARDLSIFGQHMQPYPDRKCLMPVVEDGLVVTLKRKMSNTLILNMPEYETFAECKNLSMATIEYTVFYMPYHEGEETQCDEFCTKNVTFNKTMVITSLRPYSKYVFSVGLSNYYSGLEEDRMVIGPGVVFHTAVGTPSPPQNVVVTVLNPNLAKVTWEPPEQINGNLVYYEIHNEGFISGIRQKGEQAVTANQNETTMSAIINKLIPNESYTIWVRAYSENNETFNSSSSVKIRTFPEPENITLVSSSASGLHVVWNVSLFVEKFVIQYALLTSNEWVDLNYTRLSEGVVEMVINGLKPKTLYKFRLLLNYPNYEEIYVWPKDARFSFETLGDRPSPPGIPIIQSIKENYYQVWWEASKDNGAPIEMYMLETMKTPNYRNKRSTNRTAWFSSAPSVEIPEFTWESVYNGTDSFWRINDLSDDFRYAFRVSALNSYGWSDLSEESLQFDPTVAAQMTEKKDSLKNLILPIFVSTLVLVLILIIVGTQGCRKCCSKNKKDHHAVISLRGPDVELATLRELPRRVNFVQNSNILYITTMANTDDLNLLPHIRRDQITLTKFLGCGAFGEVYEGKAKGLNGNAYETKVAVKTLRKGASDQEKTEFLQEAHLMSHFKHEHILQLLGVCLDNDPHYIIMELMQGGDLLTYLRSSRNPSMETPPLNLMELLKMCMDVAKGCRYLEEMHFVHRDLACRNCLVSSTDPERRIVKIGDFGLARDIYKNDYYRKEGEGLLPVRWMAPESLVDGVFTCQSDVWSFGVLLWEIMTLGQQPYPARNNMEVLHYVRRGGRLGKPTDCPIELYELMLSCWRCDPDGRPTFKYCLDAMERLHLQIASQPMTGAHVGQYISTVPQIMDGISNQAYFQDENHNNSGASWKSGSEEDSSRERTPFLQDESQREIPKYLTLLYDSDCPLENDGYEIPRLTKYEEPSEPKSDSGVADCDNFNKVVNDLTSIANLLKDKDNNLGYTNMNPEQNNNPKEDQSV